MPDTYAWFVAAYLVVWFILFASLGWTIAKIRKLER